MINDEINKLEMEGKLNAEELEKLFIWSQAYNTLQEIQDWFSKS